MFPNKLNNCIMITYIVWYSYRIVSRRNEDDHLSESRSKQLQHKHNAAESDIKQ